MSSFFRLPFSLLVAVSIIWGPAVLSAQELPDLPDDSPEEVYEAYRQMLREHQRQKGENYGGIGEDPSGRHEWFMFQRAYPLPYIPAGIRQRAIAETHQMRALLAESAARSAEKGILSAAAAAQWENIGPFNIAGRVRAIVVHPSLASTIYVGAATGGVWKNMGDPDLWTTTFDTNSALSIGSMAIHPTNPDIIYAGTGEVINSRTSTFNATPAYFGDGVFKSTDGGVTWKNIGLNTLGTISDLHIMQSNPEIVYATSAQGGGGVFRSTNGGETWAQQSNRGAFFGGTVFNIEVNPQNENVMLLSSTSRIYYSSDGGLTYAIASGFNPANGTRTEIALAPSDPDRVYALVARHSNDNDERNIAEVYVSNDGGQSFGLVKTFPRDFFNAQGHYNNFMAVHPENPEIAFAGGIDVFRTIDGGTTWSNRTLSYDGGNVHPDQHTLAFDPNDPRIVYLGNDGGVYKSTNTGGNWIRISEGLPISQFYEIAVDQTRPFRAYGGTQDNGSLGGFGTSEWPRAWERTLGGDGFHTVVDPTVPNIIYAESQYGSLWRISTENLGSRSYLTRRMDFRSSSDYDPGQWSTPVAISELMGALYTGRRNLWQSFDRGSTWSKLVPGNGSPISAIGLGAVRETDIMIGSSTGELFFSTDGGQNWQPADQTSQVPRRYIAEILYDPVDENRVYVVASGSGLRRHVLRSDDRGATFVDVTGNLPDIPTSALAIDPQNNEILFAGNDVGVFVSLDAGATWLPFNDGLPYVPVVDLEIHRSKRTLVAGTHGRSMFEISIENPQPTPVILKPIGGSVYESGDTIDVAWSGFLEPVRVLVSYDGGQTWDTLGVVPDAGELTFTAPFVRTDNAIIRVETLDRSLEATSFSFSIEPRPNTDGRGGRGFRAGAIAIRGDRLWAANRDKAEFVLLRLPSLLPSGTAVSHTLMPGAIIDLAYDVNGDRFFVLTADSNDFSSAQVHEMSPDGTVLGEIPLPVSSLQGIAWSNEGLVVMTPGNDGVAYVIDPADGSVVRQTEPLDGAEGASRRGLVFDGSGYYQIVDDVLPGTQVPDAIDRLNLEEDASVVESTAMIVEDGELIDGYGLAFYGGDGELGEVILYMTSTVGNFYIITLEPTSSIGSVALRDFADGVEISSVMPNPTRDRTTLSFRVDRGGEARLELFDSDGNRVAPPRSFRVEAGSGEVEIDLVGQPSGLYRAILTSPAGVRRATSIVLLR